MAAPRLVVGRAGGTILASGILRVGGKRHAPGDALRLLHAAPVTERRAA